MSHLIIVVVVFWCDVQLARANALFFSRSNICYADWHSCSGWWLEESRIHDPDTKTVKFVYPDGRENTQ